MATVMETIEAYERRIIHQKTDQEPERPTDVLPEQPMLTHEQIAARAYCLWEERGCPHGSPEADWFRAEQELGAITSSTIG